MACSPERTEMISTIQWTDLLKQQYTLVTESKGGLDLLLAMRRFVNFLNANPQARRYVKQMECEWKSSYKKWLDSCSVMRAELSGLEGRIRAIGARLDAAIESTAEIADSDALDRSKHILEKIKEIDWYQSWNTMTDALDLEALHIERPRQTQTGHMISHVLSITSVLAVLAGATAVEEEATKELYSQAEDLRRRYDAAQWKAKNDWMSSGTHALKQLKIAVEIMDGDIFVDPTNYDHSSIKSLVSWMPLMVMYAPSADLEDKFKWWLKQPDTVNKDFGKDLEPLIRSYLRQVFSELLFLANSRLAHQHLIERYKMRCENYDWKQIAEMTQSYVERVAEEAGEEGKQPRYHFEDLLTLHLARYLHDNGYAVHYTPRHGVHEPDLLGQLSNDLEPVVVEAKVVGQLYGTEQGVSWIEEGLRALLLYLQKYHSDYGVTDGYLIVFRMGDETSAAYTFDPPEWIVSGFTIVPKIINVGRINKRDPPVVVKLEDFLEKIGDGVS
jgi:hypothetical protein